MPIPQQPAPPSSNLSRRHTLGHGLWIHLLRWVYDDPQHRDRLRTMKQPPQSERQEQIDQHGSPHQHVNQQVDYRHQGTTKSHQPHRPRQPFSIERQPPHQRQRQLGPQ